MRQGGIYVGALLGVMIVSGVASAERIRGTFRFDDPGKGLRPIRNAIVEVWQLDRGAINWGHTFTAFTDENGSVDFCITFRGPNTWTYLRVYGVNDAADVYRMDEPHQKFYDKPPGQFYALTGNEDWDFSHDFTDTFSSAHYNVADALLTARRYADARRDPNETDSIGKVTVKVLNNAHNTFLEPTLHEIRMAIGRASSDFSVVHEYGHFLEARISGFYGVASYHDGCVFQAWSGGPEIGNAGLAWMEGFATYFAYAVALAHPTLVGRPLTNTEKDTLSFPENFCTPTASKPADSIEMFVTSALWNLVGSFRSNRQYCAGSAIDTDRIIFQIFDRELDLGRNPTLQEFANAWAGRALDLPPLLESWGPTASTLAFPPARPRYNASSAADFAVWRPSEGNWYVLGQSQTSQWGNPNSDDVPVPADYDGDGFTDLAIWRPSSGVWWVILSKTDRIQTTQWGQPGDVPLPADYDGDGEVDFAVYRPANGLVWVKNDNCGSDRFIAVGTGVPVVGQFDGDRKADPGVYVPATATFSIFLGLFNPPLIVTMPVGAFAGPVIGDYDGDGISDLATFEALAGRWTIRTPLGTTTSSFGTVHSLGRRQLVTATPAPADYDGDGKTDMAVWYWNDGVWHVSGSQAGPFTRQWGQPGDVPVPAR